MSCSYSASSAEPSLIVALAALRGCGVSCSGTSCCVGCVSCLSIPSVLSPIPSVDEVGLGLLLGECLGEAASLSFWAVRRSCTRCAARSHIVGDDTSSLPASDDTAVLAVVGGDEIVGVLKTPEPCSVATRMGLEGDTIRRDLRKASMPHHRSSHCMRGACMPCFSETSPDTHTSASVTSCIFCLLVVSCASPSPGIHCSSPTAPCFNRDPSSLYGSILCDASAKAWRALDVAQDSSSSSVLARNRDRLIVVDG